MAQLILSNLGNKVFNITKTITSFGPGLDHDIPLRTDEVLKSSEAAFSIAKFQNNYEIIPGALRVRVNGLSVARKTPLKSLDRIEWSGGVGILIDDLVAFGKEGNFDVSRERLVLATLQNISALALEESSQPALKHLIDCLVNISKAEEGYLCVEADENSGWSTVIASNSPELSMASHHRRQLFSSTALNEAIKKREPVYVENIIGHALGEAASIIEAKVFSIACIPLCVSGKIFGVVLLLTRSPGRSIDRNSLSDLAILATQAALLLAGATRAQKISKENAKLRAATLIKSENNSMLVCAENSPIREIQKKIQKLAPISLPVMITGETGTGKEIVARELHRLSGRADKPFIALNCAAIPGSLLESTLFGFEKGAFTGADKGHDGKFIQANGGTLFLDEIGDLSLELQAKLLRVLQENQVDKIGSRTPTKIDVRVITATHRNLKKLVSQNEFRQDLYFRIAGSRIELPPLRDRIQDIEPLIEHILNLNNIPKKFSESAVAKLEKHLWAGNVRELEQVVQKSALMSDGGVVDELDIEFMDLEIPQDSEELFWERFENLDAAQQAFTREFVERWLKKLGGNRNDAALRLGISERTLYRILADKPGRPL